MARVESDSDGSGGSSSPSSSSGHHHHHHHHQHQHQEQSQQSPSEADPFDEESITSSDDDDDNTEEDEGARARFLESRAAFFEGKIGGGAFAYSDHVELLKILERIGDTSRLRVAFERLCAICPMAPSQWLHWLQLEERNANTLEERQELHKLYRRAFTDCYSVNLYMEWSAISLSNGEGEPDPRSVLEQALWLAGSDPLDGALLWDIARENEIGRLCFAENTDSESAQVVRILDVFKRQLSRPLVQSQETLEQFRKFSKVGDGAEEAGATIKATEEAHAACQVVLKRLLEFEDEIKGTKDDETRNATEKCDTYAKYIDHVKSLLDKREYKDCDFVSLLAALYDRATSECVAPFCRGEDVLPNTAEKICVEYVEFAREYGTDEYCLDVIEKVARRCPRKCALWVLKLQQLERINKSFEEIKTEFETSLFNGFDTPEDYVSLWLCYLEILRRRTNFKSPEQIEILRKTFRLSWDSLSQLWGDEADKECAILQFWARIEYQHIKDYDNGEELFKEILSYGDNKLRGGLWLEYVWMERLRGGETSARNIFRRAVRASPDPRLQRAWLSLERDYGTLDTLTECVKICSQKAQEWENYKLQHNTNNYNFKNKSKFNYHTNDKHNQMKNNKNKSNNKKKKEDSPRKNLKRSYPEDSPNDEQTSGGSVSGGVERLPAEEFKKPKPVDVKPNNKQNLKRKTSSSENEADIPNKKSKPNDKKSAGPPPPGYEKAKSALPTNKDNYDDDHEANNRTAFISNLSFDVDEDKLRAQLAEWGEIEDLRLIKGVKSFGSICYCVYKSSDSVPVALSHDRVLLEDRPMFISRYCGSKDTRKKHFTYGTGIERNKLFVKNIPFDCCSEEQLRSVFEKFGELKEIRIVTHKTGKPKGLAYVEYVSDRSASSAVTGVDGTELGGRTLNVAISAPPPRKPFGSETSANASRLHSARTKLFVPTVLRKSSAATSSSGDGSTHKGDDEASSSSSSGNMSNSDFRNMLLGNK